MRLARIALELPSRPRGWSFAAIQDELGISERTLHRYASTAKRELVDTEGHPLLHVERRDGRPFLCLSEAGRAADGTVYQAVAVYFALSVLTFLEGTVLKEGVEDIWERLTRALPTRQRQRLADIPKKFFAVPYAAKDYREHEDTLDRIVRCLIDQHRMRIDYGGVVGEGKVHDVEPYTLAQYRGGLYLVGYSRRYERIIWLAVERIRKAEKLAERFDYPRDYTPARHTEGMFGIIGGTPTKVELLLLNPETASYLRARRIHPSQRFRTRKDGKTVLTMTVRGTDELLTWILSLGRYVEVVRPRDLREAVVGHLAASVKTYARNAAIDSRSATRGGGRGRVGAGRR